MKISFQAVGHVSAAKLALNEAHATSLGYPRIGVAETPFLAVVGNGPSVKDRVKELQSWDGDIWAINGAFHWCREHGIYARFFTIDPLPSVAKFCTGADRAILSMNCDPTVFAALVGADVQAVRFGDDGVAHGSTTATAAPCLAVEMGYDSVTLFGCESSYVGTTHADRDDPQKSLLMVECGGEQFLTSPQMLMQAETLSEMVRGAPRFVFERSGGLLAAMVSNPEVDVIAASKAFHESIKGLV